MNWLDELIDAISGIFQFIAGMICLYGFLLFLKYGLPAFDGLGTIIWDAL